MVTKKELEDTGQMCLVILQKGRIDHNILIFDHISIYLKVASCHTQLQFLKSYFPAVSSSGLCLTHLQKLKTRRLFLFKPVTTNFSFLYKFLCNLGCQLY